MFQAFLGFSIVISMLAGGYAIFNIRRSCRQIFNLEKKQLILRSYTQVPIIFILANFLYILPLSIRCLFTLEVEGGISPQLHDFASYLPGALLLQSVFFILFSFFYCRTLRIHRRKKFIINSIYLNKYIFLGLWSIILIISILMIRELASQVGGIIPLILSGYGVTELFVGRSHLVIAFDWISGLAILLLSFSIYKKSRFWAFASLGLLAVLTGAYAIMGRRAVLVVLGISTLALIHFSYREIKLKSLIVVLVSGFLALNVLGLLRGDSYENFSSMIEVVLEKNQRNQAEDSAGLMYTVTTGNFAIPFETMPQIMSRWGDSIFPRMGITFVSSAALLVPNALWVDRPLPLANWYMREFYDSDTPLNEGRQFYFLSESYLNFGPFGVILWALMFGMGMARILIGVENRKDNFLIIAFFSLFVGNILNLISSDFFGWMIAFFKGFGFPAIILIVINSINKLLFRNNKS